MDARSLRGAGRPVLGRPAAAVITTLIALLAVGAPVALADEPATGGAVAEPADPPPQGAVAASPAVEAPVGQAPVGEAPVGQAPVGEAPVEVTPVESPAVEEALPESPPVEATPAKPPPGAMPQPNPPPAVDPPAAAQPAGPSGGTAPVTTPEWPPAEAPDGGTPAPPRSSDSAGTGGAVAQNVSTVIQAVWQVQQGCRSYCYGTSQSQTSTQWSQTTQSATAVAGGSDSGGAVARNESSTIQFVWQMQIGCVAFCYDTTQSQQASQYASTDQVAEAKSALTAWAENLAETIQHVFQTQRGCEHECHGVSQSQSSTQAQSTTQSASAKGDGGQQGDGPGHFLVPDWLVAYAQSIGATIQTVYQYQEALCLERCVGDSQLQEAAQRAETDQRAVARVAPPPEEPVPGEPPPAERPPASAPDGAGAAPGLAAPLPPAVAGPAIRDRRARKEARPQELTLGGLEPRSGGGAAPGVAPPPSDRPAAESWSGASGGRRAGAQVGDRRPPASDQRSPATDAQPPATTITVDSGPTPGNSVNWLAVALAAAALAALVAAVRGRLASNLSRI